MTQTLLAPQRQLLRRLRLSNVLSLAVWALALGLALRLAGHVFGFAPQLWIGFVGLGAVLLAVVRDFRLDHRLAYRLDRLAGLNHGYATATALSQSQTDPGPVGRLLLAQQEAAARGLSLSKLAPLPKRSTWIGALLALGTLALSYNLTVQPAPLAPPSESESTEGPALEEAEVLAQLAERLAEDAQKDGNSYLAAVAKSLEEAAQSLETDSADTEALRSEIDALLEHARRAYGEKPPSWLTEASGQPLQNVLQSFLDGLEREAEAAARAAARADPNNPAFDMYARDPSLEERYQGRDTTETLNAQAMDGAPGSPEKSDSAENMASSAGGAPRRMQDEEMQSLGGVPIGAALESGKGESDMAGLGSREFEDDATYRDIVTSEGEQISLSAEPQAGGNRIRIEIAPEANDTVEGAGAAMTRFTPTELDRAAMGADRSTIPVSARSVVAKYLDRRVQSASESAE